MFNPIWSEDKLIWNFTTNDIYTVKTSYKVGTDFTISSTSTTSPACAHHDFRSGNYIHSLLVQLSLESFYGELCLISFLQEKIFGEEDYTKDLIVFTVDRIENDRYALFYCDFAKNVWDYILNGMKWTRFPSLSFKDLMHLLSLLFERKEVVVFVTCVWLIWFSKNQLHHEGIFTEVSLLPKKQ